MKSVCVLLLFTALLAAQPNTLTPGEVAGGWILLFDGETLFGWTAENKSQWRATNGTIVADSGPAGWLRSNSPFADYILTCEFRTAADGNSGIFLRSAKEGQAHITGYELQIFDNQPAGFHTGALVNHVKAQQPVKIRPGQWMNYEVELSGNHFLIKLDGKTVVATRDDKSRAGHIGLQFNPDKKIEFRNIKLKPLGVQPLFNGRDLRGWQVVEAARPAKQPPVWSVKEGAIHVEHGPGQLETEATFDDFVLQLDVRANAQGPTHHPNSGVFLRGDPKGYWTGYESQIRNEFKGDDRSQPVDFGTGGVYHFQPARKVVSSDNQFFTKTIVARGPHIAVWVNGYPVSDYEDTRAPGMNARKEARLAAGTLSLQAHDPTTNLDFKNIRIARLPK